jgi:hypothetical protein
MESSCEASIRRVSRPVKSLGEHSALSTTMNRWTPSCVCKQAKGILLTLDVPGFERMTQAVWITNIVTLSTHIVSRVCEPLRSSLNQLLR